MTRRRFLLATGLFCACLAALGHTSHARTAEAKELVVYAAASLREAFQDLATAFEKKHQGVKVQFNFSGSQELRVQIEHGAQVDVFASADEKHMAALEKQSLVKSSAIFARNEPVLVVATANPAGLKCFADLPKAEHIVVGVPEVPIGAYTESILAKAESVLGKPFREQVVAHIRSR